jgi:hypothetical protein
MPISLIAHSTSHHVGTGACGGVRELAAGASRGNGRSVDGAAVRIGHWA